MAAQDEESQVGGWVPPALRQAWGGVWGKCGVTAVSSLSVGYTGQVRLQIWGGQKLQRWHDEGPRGYTVTLPPSSFSTAWRINSEWRVVYVLICVLSVLSGLWFCLMRCSHSGSPPMTPIKREGCPLPATLRHASPASRERGPIIYYLFPSC